jgi:2-polyprenyl-3-methyl-5-hydroxy-6-metoxy-1,4-benzoquinol methylase
VRNAQAFLSALERRSRLLAARAQATFDANRELCCWLLDPLAHWAEAAYGDTAFDDAALGYARYCLGVGKAQELYERAGRYTPQALPGMAAAVGGDARDTVAYMWAAILIYAFWPSMVSHLALFRDEFLRRLPREAAILELACGHGVLSLLAAQERPDVCVTGLDISAAAIGMANRLGAAAGHGERVRFGVADVLEEDAAAHGHRYAGVVSAMLAEHLPAPRALFAAIARRLTPGGLVFFSAALESAQWDHVFEFHAESEPLRMAEQAGLRASRLVSDASVVAAQARFLPRATAMILRTR